MAAIEESSCTPLKAREFAKISQLAYDAFGLDLRTGKETLVSTRLGRYIRQSGCRSFDEYYRRVVEDSTGELLINLIDALATNHTSFFREPEHFEFLRQTIAPAWNSRENIRIWSAACSTGEEPYSIAMCLAERLGRIAPGRIRILATDISTRALAKAEPGVYPAERLDGLPAAQLRKFWLRGDHDYVGWYRVKKELRAMVEFRRLNLLDPAARPGSFHLIFCRNVMIYFDRPTQQGVVKRLAACLEPGGYLLTGHAESLSGIDHGLRHIQPAIYRKVSPGDRGKGTA